MKTLKYYFNFILLLLTLSCTNNKTRIEESHIFLLDSSIEQSAKKEITELDTRYYNPKYNFTTPVNGAFYLENEIEEKLDTFKIPLISSYWWKGDTLFLFANLGQYSTQAMFVKINRGDAEVRFLRCDHENIDVYKLNYTDSLKQCVYAPCPTYKLIISAIPDTTNKQTIYGHIAFESDNYFYWNHVSSKLEMERCDAGFYFRSNFELQK